MRQRELIPATHFIDFYKSGHKPQYPDDTVKIYSNITARMSRITEIDGVVSFGFQPFAKQFLSDYWNDSFFYQPKDVVLKKYKRRMDYSLGPNVVKTDHIADLHDLGYLPLCIKAIPEGTIVPLRVPLSTLYNTIDEFFWLTNYVETVFSDYVWHPITEATIAVMYRRVFERYARQTGGSLDFVKWQGHDFSMRGLEHPFVAASSGVGHLLSFTGTDTVPAIDFAEMYYGANCETELIGGSVPATEHSVMCMGLKDGEQATIERLITKVHPSGIVSLVMDTWDLWKVLMEYLPALKTQIMQREGKVVIRPDSGDPVKILCGDPSAYQMGPFKGVVQLLYEVFGGEKNAQGYIELDPHIGAIYGDSITPDRQVAILEGLKAKGFASTNVVLGIGSYTYQYTTRDTFGLAMKATYGERMIDGVRKGQAIFKDPKTDNGVKKSAYGLLYVGRDEETGRLMLEENVTWEREAQGLLQPIFLNGHVKNFQTLAEIRARVEAQL